MAIPIAYNIRHLAQRRTSTLATALGIGLVVAIFIGTLALASGFQAALVQTGSPSNVIVLRTGADSEISSSLSRDVVNILRARQEIAVDARGRPLSSAELVVLVNQPRLGQTGSSNVPIRGIDPSGFALRSQVTITQGRMFAAGTDEVIVGRRIARRFAGFGIGDRLRFGQRDFRVVGHFDAGGSAFDSEAWGDANVLGPALGREGAFQSFTFTLRDTSRFRPLERELEQDPRLGVELRTERQWYAEQSRLLASVLRVAGVVITLIMAVGAMFGAMNTMYAAVSHRTREIAMLLVLGFSPAAVMASFVLESTLLALVGGVIGCLVALPINGLTTSTTNWSSFSEIAFAFRVTPGALAAGLGFAALMGVAGGFFPSRRAARQTLAASIREG